MAEGIVNEHKVLVVDADGEFREKEYWQKFLPAVYKVKDGESKEAASTTSSDGLKVAWRYNNLLEESKVGAGGAQQEALHYRFDSSREMGTSYANSQSQSIAKEEYLVHLKLNKESSTLRDLWENILE